jgi:hypothetical protein
MKDVQIGVTLEAMKISKLGYDVEPFWMVWRAGSFSTRYKHRTVESAVTECARLAALNPDRRYYILEGQYYFDGPK